MIYNPYTDGSVKLGFHNTWTWRRKYGFIPTGDDLYTSEFVLTYFDKWLNELGWKNFEGHGSPCDFMIEAYHLEKGTNLLAYVSNRYYRLLLLIGCMFGGMALYYGRQKNRFHSFIVYGYQIIH